LEHRGDFIVHDITDGRLRRRNGRGGDHLRLNRPGTPILTTHTITGAVVGVGAVRRRAVRWGVAGQIVSAWLLTIPSAAAVAALLYSLISLVSPGG
jgi:Phosphate transporter family